MNLVTKAAPPLTPPLQILAQGIQSNLTLALYDSDGTSLIEFSNDTGLGLSETIDNYLFSTPGDYFVSADTFGMAFFADKWPGLQPSFLLLTQTQAVGLG